MMAACKCLYRCSPDKMSNQGAARVLMKGCSDTAGGSFAGLCACIPGGELCRVSVACRGVLRCSKDVALSKKM
jgi:hypothetical protein